MEESSSDDQQLDLADPVRFIPGDGQTDLESGIGLCLSGGGYRAMLFHVGALWRLRETGLLTQLDRISSVSGGSITSAVLALGWEKLAAEEGSEIFEQVIANPLREFASQTVDESAIALGILAPGSIGERVASALSEHLLGDATLQDLPDEPRFVINATNLASGVLWRFSKPYMADYRVGMIREPLTRLAEAVAASAAFPPVLSPFVLELAEAAWESPEGADLDGAEYRDEVRLADGGVYDNLGLETVWKRCRTVLVSDGGGRLAGGSRSARRLAPAVDSGDEGARQSGSPTTKAAADRCLRGRAQKRRLLGHLVRPGRASCARLPSVPGRGDARSC